MAIANDMIIIYIYIYINSQSTPIGIIANQMIYPSMGKMPISTSGFQGDFQQLPCK